MHTMHRPLKNILCATALILSLLFMASCTSPSTVDLSKINMNDVTLDVEMLSDMLLQRVTFDDTLVPIEDDVAAQLFGIGGLYHALAAFGSTGATAEMLVLLRAESATEAEAARDHFAVYRDEMAAVYADYNMKESEKLTDAVLACYGRYVLFCVSPDREAVTKAYTACITELLK